MRLPKFGLPKLRLPSWITTFLQNPSNVAIVILLAIIVGSGLVWLTHRTNKPGDLRLTSPSFGNGYRLPTQFTCDGEGISPAFNIKRASPEAKTLAIIFEDLDLTKEQRQDSPYLAQQMVWNIPITTTFAQGVRPPGTMGRTLSGGYGYDAPCPPTGKTHRYRFTLYELRTNSLAVGADAGVDELKRAISSVKISKDELEVVYTGKNKKK